jgi:hypothetical protein
MNRYILLFHFVLVCLENTRSVGKFFRTTQVNLEYIVYSLMLMFHWTSSRVYVYDWSLRYISRNQMTKHVT